MGDAEASVRVYDKANFLGPFFSDNGLVNFEKKDSYVQLSLSLISSKCYQLM